MINFADVEKRVKTLNSDFAEGKITEQFLEERLLDLIDVAEDGHYWMLGHRTGRWFRHDGKKWTLNDPEIAFNEVTPGLIEDTQIPSQEEEVGYDAILFTLLLIIFVGVIIYTGSINWWSYSFY